MIDIGLLLDACGISYTENQLLKLEKLLNGIIQQYIDKNVQKITSDNSFTIFKYDESKLEKLNTFEVLEINETGERFKEEECNEICTETEVKFEEIEQKEENSSVDNATYFCETEIKENPKGDISCVEISVKNNHVNFECEMCGICFENKEKHMEHNA